MKDSYTRSEAASFFREFLREIANELDKVPCEIIGNRAFSTWLRHRVEGKDDMEFAKWIGMK